MDIKEVAEVFNPHLNSQIVAYAVRPTTIWTLLSDSSICIFKRSNMRVFSKFPFDGHNPSTAKMSVDENGEKCVIYWDRLPILFFSLATGIVCELTNLNPAFHPTAVCWLTLPGKSPLILVGSLVGEFLTISSDEEHAVTPLFSFSDPLTIREIYAYVKDEVKMVFALIQEQIHIFITKGPFEKIFTESITNKVLILGDVGPNNQMDHRLTIDTFDGYVRLSALHFLGIVSFRAIQHKNGSFEFDQTITEVETMNATSFDLSPLGLLLVLDRNILLLSNSKPKATIPISGVQHIVSDENGVVLFMEDEIITIPIKGLLNYVVKAAVEHKDFKYALKIAKDDPIKFFVLKNQVENMPRNEVGPYVLSLRWSLKEVASSLGLESMPMLLYLRELLKKCSSKNKRKQRYVAINWAFTLHATYYPELEEEFVEFITDYGKDMNAKTVYDTLYEIGFERGVFIFAEVINDYKTITDQRMLLSSDKEVLRYLSKLNDMEFISETLLRILKNNFDGVKRFMLRNKLKLSVKYSLPILSHMPHYAHYVLSDAYSDEKQFYLLIISLGLNHIDERLSKVMIKNRKSVDNIIRFAISYECYPSAAKMLVNMEQPKLAVRVAKKVSLAYANTLIVTIADTKMQKDAWIELLKIVTPEEKDNVLRHVIASHLFTFEEIIEIIGDDAYLFEYAEDLLNAVTEQENEAEIVHYRVHFRPITPSNFPVSYEEGCSICQFPLLGTKFVNFPCGHKMHLSCLEKCINELRRSHPDFELNTLDSCPICGIYSVMTALQPFSE